MKFFARLWMAASLACVASAPFARADNAVLFWNEQALNATRLARNPPPVIALWFGTYHAAIADAVNGIDGRWESWLVTERAPQGADRDAAIASAAYTVLKAIWGHAEELKRVTRVGARDNAERSDYDTLSVAFWSDALGTSGPAGHWNMITQNMAREKNLSTIECARLFALLNFAAADGFISCWDTKYYYNVARPETDIREIDKSTNPHAEQKPDFIPNMPSLPFPSYTSAHMTFSTAAARVLALYFGTDEVPFSVTSDGLPGVVRSYKSFSAASDEVGASRVFGGIHTDLDVREARKAGRSVGEWVYAHALQLREP